MSALRVACLLDELAGKKWERSHWDGYHPRVYCKADRGLGDQMVREPRDVPALPLVLGEAAYVVQSRKREDYRPHITKAEREHTPPQLAGWLVDLAARCKLANAQVTGRP